MPTALPSRTTGTPEMFFARVSSSTSRIVASGRTVIGSWMMPLSKRLTRADLARLRLDGHVLVDDADAAFLRDRDREAVLGDGVHGGRDDRQVQADRARELRGEADFVRQDLRVGRHEQDVVESEGFLENSQHGVTRAEGSATLYPSGRSRPAGKRHRQSRQCRNRGGAARSRGPCPDANVPRIGPGR